MTISRNPLIRTTSSAAFCGTRWPTEDARGFALVSVLILVLLGMTLVAGTALYAALDLKSTQHYSTGNQAFAAAEAGVLDVINAINTRGVVNLQNDIVNSGVIPTTVTPLSGFPNYTYQVTGLTSVAGSVATDAVLTVTGRAPVSAERVLRVSVHRQGFTAGPGALHLSNDTATGSFSGTSFLIDGNNHNPDGTLDPSVAPRPAVSTRNDTVTSAIVAGLSSGQAPDLLGLGYSASPLTPSVETTDSASTADILQLISDILAGLPANGPLALNKLNNGNLNNANFGTAAQPLVTELTNSSPKIAGNVTGYGILIVDQDLDLQGTMNFYGWVLFKNPSSGGIKVGGNATIFGSVWSPLPAFSGNGNITIDYCQTCLGTYADRAGNGGGNNGYMPHQVVVSSWQES